MAWDIPEGAELKRRTIHDRFGGSRQPGITTARELPSSILLFDTAGGSTYGYDFDGPQENGSYHYTGEGTKGDQVFTKGNALVRYHAAQGKVLRLFKGTRRTYVKYLGEWVLDAADPFSMEEGPDINKELRQVIVFRLCPVGETATVDIINRTTIVVDVELEAHNVDRFHVNRAQDVSEAERREAQLVQRYADWLTARGGKVSQRLITPPGRMAPLRTDLFDVAGNEIVEAKGSTDRSSVRMALGQVLDYGQYLPKARRAVLLPTRPPDDMVSLLTSLGISCVYEIGEGFSRDESAHDFCANCPLISRSDSAD